MCIKNPTPLQTRKVIRDLQRRFQILLWTQTEVKVKVEPLKIHASNYKRIPEPQNLLSFKDLHTDAEEDNKVDQRALPFQSTAALELK